MQSLSGKRKKKKKKTGPAARVILGSALICVMQTCSTYILHVPLWDVNPNVIILQGAKPWLGPAWFACII